VLPTPLPQTQLIPPEGQSAPIARCRKSSRRRWFLASPGRSRICRTAAETFPDRASRCAFQKGINGVPGTASTRYMGACLQ